jgi:hypothetical protein
MALLLIGAGGVGADEADAVTAVVRGVDDGD